MAIPNFSLKPHCCLIANDGVTYDPFFKRSVIYLTTHMSDEDIQGFVLTHPSPVSIDVLIQKFHLDASVDLQKSEDPLLLGGPCNPSSVFFLGDKGTIDILTETRLRAFIQDKNIPDLFLGYSAWKPNNLTFEIHKGYWEMLPPSPEIFKVAPAKRYAWAQQKLGINRNLFNSDRPGNG